MSLIEEIKAHKNKETQRFLCTVLHRDAHYLVLYFSSQAEGRIRDIIIPAGSTTIAHYWSDRGYVVWRMFGPDGSLIGTLFHICTNVEITEQHVSYLDLIVDIWIAPDGTIRVLDQDEMEECKKEGLIGDDEAIFIEKQKQLIINHHEEIMKSLWVEAEYSPESVKFYNP